MVWAVLGYRGKKACSRGPMARDEAFAVSIVFVFWCGIPGSGGFWNSSVRPEAGWRGERPHMNEDDLVIRGWGIEDAFLVLVGIDDGRHNTRRLDLLKN